MTGFHSKNVVHRPNVVGAYRLGLLAISFPRIATLIVTILSIVCAVSTIAYLQFDGEPSNLFSGETYEYELFSKFESNFHPYSKDEVLLVSSPVLATQTSIEKLRDLHFELQFLEGVKQVVSVFSVAKFSTQDNQWSSELLAEFSNDAQVRSALTKLIGENALGKLLLTDDLKHILFFVSPNLNAVPHDASGGKEAINPQELDALLEVFQSEGFEIKRAGEPAIERDLIGSVKRDALVLSVSGTLIAMLIAFSLFRSLPALIATLAPLLVAIIWYLGAISFLGLKIDAVTVIIPVLVMVLTFADSVHLYMSWRNQVKNGEDPISALRYSIQTVGSAAALASFITGIAFIVFLIASSEVLDRMAFSGLIGVCVVYLSTIVVCPISILYVAKLFTGHSDLNDSLLRKIGDVGASFLTRHPFRAFKISLIMLPVLIFSHLQLAPQFSLLDYLPVDSGVKAANSEIEILFGGSDQASVIIRRNAPGPAITPEEFRQLADIEDIVRSVFNSRSAISLNSVILKADGQDSPVELVPANVQQNINSMLSKDLHFLSVTAPVPASITASEMISRVGELEEKLRNNFPEVQFEITGGAAMRSAIAPRLIEELRIGLIVSVILSVLVIGLSFGSWQISIASILPNVIPILLAEFYIWITTGSIELSAAIALIVGFGLAVDDTIHFLGHYVQEKRKSADEFAAIKTALVSVSPALIATTAIIGLGFSVTLFATLPTVFTFGYLVIGIFFFALIADILVLPSVLLFMRSSLRK
ncbi:MAG: MMPL family transporter [Pseudomonadota bacterium]